MRNLFAILILLLSIQFASAITYETYSPYWTSHTDTSGPKSQAEAIKNFFDNRKLDMIEGVWQENDYGTIAIVKISSTKYAKYIIYTPNYELNGTKEATIFLNPNTNTHNMFIRIEWETDSGFRYATSKAELIYHNPNTLSDYIFDYVDDHTSTYSRIWPENILTHNKKFSKENSEPIDQDNDLVEFISIILVVLALTFIPIALTIILIRLILNKELFNILNDQKYSYTIAYFSLIGYWAFEKFYLKESLYDASIGALIVLAFIFFNFLISFLLSKKIFSHLIKDNTIFINLLIASVITALQTVVVIIFL